jgi:iron complex outermembrane receptor protein
MGSDQTVQSRKSRDLRRAALIGLASTTTLSTMTTWAQDADPQGATLQEIVVTGSRIARRDYISNSPIASASEQDFKLTASATPEVFLNTLPQVVPDSGASSTDQRRGGGGTHINLRGLGPQRNLVLLDGRRLIAANASGYTDVSILPTALIERVEVITGGASAVYGADAVAGVVNFILKERVEGISLEGQYGITERGDGQEFSMTGTLGGSFADDRGRAVASYSYYDRSGITMFDRAFSRPSEYATVTTWGGYNPVGNLPSQAAVDALFQSYGFAPGSVLATDQLGINDDGSLFSLSVSATAPPVTNFRGSLDDPEIAGHFLPGRFAYQYSPMTGLIAPLDRHNVFGDVTYDLSDNITAFGRLVFSSQSVMIYQGPSTGASPTMGGAFDIPITNPFIPDDLRTLLASRDNPTASFRYSARLGSLGVRKELHETDVYQVSGGLRGRLANDWRWEVYASQGNSRTITRRDNAGSYAAIQRLLTAPDGGASQCAGGLNVFSRAPISEECLAIINPTSLVTTELETTIAETSLTGDLLNLPAGAVGFALGAQYRSEQVDFAPDNLIATGDLGGFARAVPIQGAFHNTDVFAEVLVPILSNAPFAKVLSLSGGLRYSDHSVVGSYSSHKIDAEWAPVDAVRLRASYQRAVRAPNIQELFTPVGTANVVVSDPCNVNSLQRTGADAAAVRALCIAQGVPENMIDSYNQPTTAIIATTGGNLSLREEKADTYTFGAVFSLPASSGPFSGMTFSIDHYQIDLSDAISSLQATNYVPRCFNAQNSNPTYSADNVFCQLFRRRFDGGITDAVQNSINVASLEVSGIDFQLSWRPPVPYAFGNLGIDLTVGWLRDYERQDSPIDAKQQLAGTIGQFMGTALPQWKGALTTTYQLHPVTVIGRLRYIGEMTNAVNVVTPGSGTNVPSTWYFDLSSTIDVSEQMQFRLGVVNVFDQQPRLYTPQQQAHTDPSTYDVLGRRLTAGFTMRF